MEVMKTNMEMLNLSHNCNFYFDGGSALVKAIEIIESELLVKLKHS
jgi:hypothetical protein